MTRVILMDFDGVLMRHPPVLKRVQGRVVEYVRKYAGKGHMSEGDATRLNRDLYQRYGHTHLGMKKLFMPYSRVSSFNHYVYEPAFLNELYQAFGKDPDCLDGLQSWESWIDDQLYEGDVEQTAIFSNSPASWVSLWLSAAGMEDHFQEILGSDHPLFEGRDDSLLKPDPRLYDRVETYIPDPSLYFVEDSPLNLDPVVKRDRWIPMLFDGDDVVKYE
jgi:FMN phosphatase YigB (HAD superfamily)